MLYLSHQSVAADATIGLLLGCSAYTDRVRGVRVAKAKKKRSRLPAASDAPTGDAINLGRSVDLTVTKFNVEAAEIKLSDGASLKIRPIIMEVKRSRDRYNGLGEPIYQIKTALLIETKVPKKFLKKSKGSK